MGLQDGEIDDPEEPYENLDEVMTRRTALHQTSKFLHLFTKLFLASDITRYNSYICDLNRKWHIAIIVNDTKCLNTFNAVHTFSDRKFVYVLISVLTWN